MKFVMLAAVLLTLIGCNSTPVKAPFPKAPDDLLIQPKALKPITIEDKDHIALSEMMVTVATNYGICKENAVKYVAWQEWYKTSKKQYEEAGVVK